MTTRADLLSLLADLARTHELLTSRREMYGAYGEEALKAVDTVMTANLHMQADVEQAIAHVQLESQAVHGD